MNLFRLCLIFLALTGLMLQGCGEKPAKKPVVSADQDQAKLSQVQSALAAARDQLAKEKEKTTQLAAEVASLKEQAEDQEEKLPKSAEAQKSAASRPTEEPEGGALEPDTKVRLLGAKAIAEFKATQLSQRLDKLTKDLDAKEQELFKIRQNAKQKDYEVAQLTAKIQQLQQEDQKRTAEVTSRMEGISRELSARSSDVDRLKEDLKDKSELLATLKSSANDCTKLKTQTEQEAQNLRAELDKVTARLQATEKIVLQAKQEIEQCHERDTECRDLVARYQEAADQFRADAQAASESVKNLQGQVADLQSRLKAAEPQEEEGPSTVDRLIERPMSKKSRRPKQSLY